MVVELLILFPLVRLLAGRTSVRVGFLVMLVFECLWELFTYLVDMDAGLYRLIVLRYCIFVYTGIVIHRHVIGKGNAEWRRWAALMPLGFVYIVVAVYLGLRPNVLFRYDTWYRSAAPVVFWTAPIVAMLMMNSATFITWLRDNRITSALSTFVQH